MGHVLPKNPAGQEVVVDEGVSIAFPDGGSEIPKEPLVFGVLPKRAKEPPMVAKATDSAQLILSGFGIFLSKKSERLLVKLKRGLKAYKGDGRCPQPYSFQRLPR